MAFSHTQLVALAVVPKITGTISGCFSLVIVWIVLRSQKRRSHTFHRMMAALSLVDASTSLWNAMSTWPAPRDSGALYAIGTDTSCTIQGFFLNMSVTSVLYNLSLSIFYLLVIRFSWRNESINRIEPLLHGLPWLWGVGTGLVTYFHEAFDFATLWCWIRGDEDVLRWTVLYGPLFACMVLIFINCYITWRHVHVVERKNMNYRFSSSGSVAQSSRALSRPQTKHQREFRRSRQLARQCFLYAGGFYVAWAAIATTRFLQIFDRVYYPLVFLAAFCTPMQGLPNILIYLLPEVRKLQKKNPRLGWIKGFFEAVVNLNGNAYDLNSINRGGVSGRNFMSVIRSSNNEGNSELNSTGATRDRLEAVGMEDQYSCSDDDEEDLDRLAEEDPHQAFEFKEVAIARQETQSGEVMSNCKSQSSTTSKGKVFSGRARTMLKSISGAEKATGQGPETIAAADMDPEAPMLPQKVERKL